MPWLLRSIRLQAAGTYTVTVTIATEGRAGAEVVTEVVRGTVDVTAEVADLLASPITSPPVTQRLAVAGTPLKFRVQPQDRFGNRAELPSGTLAVRVSLQSAAPRLQDSAFTFEPYQLVCLLAILRRSSAIRFLPGMLPLEERTRLHTTSWPQHVQSFSYSTSANSDARIRGLDARSMHDRYTQPKSQADYRVAESGRGDVSQTSQGFAQTAPQTVVCSVCTAYIA